MIKDKHLEMMIVLGLRYDSVKLSQYCPEWEELYKEEEVMLYGILHDLVSDIQHIGSTSIKGMISKPIIDIMIVVKSQLDAHKCIPLLVQIGYEYFGECGRPGRLFFVKSEGVNSTHHIHIVEHDSCYQRDFILFRDFIRENKDAAEKYAQYKRELEALYGNDRTAYRIGKSTFVQRTLLSARKKKFYKDLNEAYTKLKSNPNDWESELEERDEWDSILADGLEKEEVPIIQRKENGHVL